MERRKLFSEEKKVVRRKLFSSDCPDTEENSRFVICQDCGYRFETTASPTALVCPKCGGTRFNVELQIFSPDNTPERVEPVIEKEENNRRKLFSTYAEDEALFQKEFSKTENEYEENLKLYSGKEISAKRYDELFGDSELIERGYAEKDGNTVKISGDAFLMDKLFSKMIISVTKEFDLDPDICCGYCNKEDIINKLEEEGNIPTKGIMLIRKAHGISTQDHDNKWLNDSGILTDLPIEFNNSSTDEPKFIKIIEERYPDAPDNILDLLKARGIIESDGKTVNIK